MKTEEIIILGGLAIGAYFIYTKFLKPIQDVTGTIGGAIGSIIPAAEKAGDIFFQPIIQTPPEYIGVQAPSPINYGVPITGVPGFVKFAQTPTGGTGTPTPTFGSFLFPPLGIPGAIEAAQKAAPVVAGAVKGGFWGGPIGVIKGALESMKPTPKITYTDYSTHKPTAKELAEIARKRRGR